MPHPPSQWQDSPEVLLARAQAACRAGDLKLGARIAAQAARAAPKNPEALHRAGHLMGQVGNPEQAITLLRRAIALRPKEALWHHDLAVVLHRRGEYEQAAKAYRRAADLAPENVNPLAGLAEVHRRMRNLDLAERIARQVLDLAPSNEFALVLIARLRLRAGELEEAESLLQRVLRTTSNDEYRATAWHLLGDVAEKLRRWDDAFERHMSGNRVFLAMPRTRAARAGGRYDRIHRYLPDGAADLYARWADAAPDDGLPTPAFLVGFPRSGTTLTEQIVAAHPRTLTTDERNYVETVHHSTLRLVAPADDDAFLHRLDTLSDDRLRELRALYWASVERDQGRNARRRLLLDKNPLQILDVGLIARFFPTAPIVVMIRDPRDACLSALFQHFDINAGTVRMLEVEDTGRFYATVMDFWRRIRDLIPNPHLELRYEDLVQDFDTHAPRLIEFLGLDWRDEIQRFHEKAAQRAVQSSSAESVTRKLNTSAVGRWRNYRDHLGPLMDHVRPFVEAYAYED